VYNMLTFSIREIDSDRVKGCQFLHFRNVEMFLRCDGFELCVSPNVKLIKSWPR
jgi:hypothetical protein